MCHWKSPHHLFFSNPKCKHHFKKVLLSPQIHMDGKRWVIGFASVIFPAILRSLSSSQYWRYSLRFTSLIRRVNLAVLFNRYLFQDISVQHFRWKAVLLRSLTPSLLKGERPYGLPYIAAQSPESSSHVKPTCKYHQWKGCLLHFLPCCWSDCLVAPPSSPPITYIHSRNSIHLIEIKYDRKYWKIL